MGSSIDVKKLSPSPELAGLLGFMKGLNNKKKELEEKETAEAKQAIEEFRAKSLARYQDRTASVSEQNALTNIDNAETNRMNAISMEKDRVERIKQAEKNINIALDTHKLDLRKFDLDLQTKSLRYRQAVAKEEALAKAEAELPAREKIARLEGRIRKEVALATQERLFPHQVKLAQMAGDTSKEVAGMNITGRAEEGSKNRATQIAIAEARLDMQWLIAEAKEKVGTSKDPRINTYNAEYLHLVTELEQQTSATEKDGKTIVPKPLSEDTIKVLLGTRKNLLAKYNILKNTVPEGSISEPPDFGSEEVTIKNKRAWNIIPYWMHNTGTTSGLLLKMGGGASVNSKVPKVFTDPVKQESYESIMSNIGDILNQVGSDPKVLRQYLIEVGKEDKNAVDKVIKDLTNAE